MSSAGSPVDAGLLAAVTAGGAIGASARYLLTLAWPSAGALTILAVNVVGCLAMGVLVALTDRLPRLGRPFLGTGVLGGFTTVSTYAVTADALLVGDAPAGLAYLVVTPVLAVIAAGVGTTVTRWLRS